jgi:uncharacterized protein
MGLLDRVEAELSAEPPPEPEHVNGAFWAACHGGQLATAQRLLAAGAEISWVAPWDGLTPLDAARRSESDGVATWQDVADWLVAQGARSASEPT